MDVQTLVDQLEEKFRQGAKSLGQEDNSWLKLIAWTVMQLISKDEVKRHALRTLASGASSEQAAKLYRGRNHRNRVRAQITGAVVEISHDYEFSLAVMPVEKEGWKILVGIGATTRESETSMIQWVTLRDIQEFLSDEEMLQFGEIVLPHLRENGQMTLIRENGPYAMLICGPVRIWDEFLSYLRKPTV